MNDEDIKCNICEESSIFDDYCCGKCYSAFLALTYKKRIRSNPSSYKEEIMRYRNICAALGEPTYRY